MGPIKRRKSRHLCSSPRSGLYATTIQKPNFDSVVEDYLDTPGQLSLPNRLFTPAEVWREINLINLLKAPGYDLITGKVLKELPRKALVLLTTIYNSILRLAHFPLQ